MVWRDLRVKVVGFEFAGNRYLYLASGLRYRPDPEMTQLQLADGEKRNRIRWIHLQFELRMLFKTEQLNAGTTYTLSSGGSPHPSAPLIGLDGIINRFISNNDVRFYPVVDTGAGSVDLTTFYDVELLPGSLDVSSRRGGFISGPPSFRFTTRAPLSEYPAWASF